MRLGERATTPVPDHRATERRGLLLAAVIGCAVGMLAVVFQLGVEGIERFGREVASPFAQAGAAQLATVIAAGILLGGLSGWLTQRFCPEAGGSGIPYIKAALMNLRPMRPWRAVFVKIGGGLLALGAGMSLGREGPTIQIGGS